MIYIITGTSSGIGSALATLYLDKGHQVIGISRRNHITHPNFTFVSCDLSSKQDLHELSLSKYISKENYPIRLINNAGIIGDIRRLDKLSLTHYTDMAMVNIVAPQYLASYVIQTFGFENVDMILNITSGAGQYPVSSWGAYCSSKAAINLFAETINLEVKELNQATKIYNVAPGVVDTSMQEVIRSSNKDEFSRHDEFVQLKENAELRSPEEAAALLEQFIENPPAEEDGIIHRI